MTEVDPRNRFFTHLTKIGVDFIFPGPLRVARGIHERIKNGSKFGIITSRMGSIDDNGSGGMYGYRQGTKLFYTRNLQF